jgi:hypothetical protein
MERSEQPVDYYSDLIDQVTLRMDEFVSADGGGWEVKRDEFIGSCMKAKGFGYYPNEVEPVEEGESDIRAGDRRLWVPWLPDDLAEVERYGYGYLNLSPAADHMPSLDPASDLNERYVASLSVSAQREYQVALMGAELADYVSSGAPMDIALPEMGGCWAEADRAHPSPVLRAAEELPTVAYEDLIDQMRDQAGDPYSATFVRRAEVDHLNSEWLECFERDFPPAEPAELPEGLTVIADGDGYSSGPTAAWNLAVNTNEAGESWDPGPEGKEAPAEYASLTGTSREIAIAVADYRCRVETDYVARFLAIEREAQEEFIAAHQAELDEMVAALEEYING